MAFTLAEVLVTLGIIGVVSAMTLPTLVKNHQRQVYVTQLQKVVTELSQAAEKAIQDNNAVSLEETKYHGNNPNAAKDFLNDNFKIAKDCGTDLTPCFASSYKWLDGTEYTFVNTPDAVVSLASGVSIFIMEQMYMNHNMIHGDYGYYEMQVDINGAQGPNIAGRDLFYMELYSDGKVADSYDTSPEVIEENIEKCSRTDINYGIGCLTKIMHDGWKMDY